MAREPAATDAPARDASQRDAKPTDVRSARPYIFQKGPLRGALRRLGSVAALAFLDVSGVALGLYSALAIREFVYGTFPPLWGVMWQAVEEWLPFLALITLLVFWQGGLYANREVRARRRPDPPVHRARGAADGGVRDRLGARVRHVRPRPDGRGDDDDHDRGAARELRGRDARRPACRRRPAPRRPRRQGRAPARPEARARLGPGRYQLRVRGRGRLRRHRPGPPGARRHRRAPRRARLDAHGRADRDGGRPRRDGAARDRRAGAPARREGAGRAEDDGAADGPRRVRAGPGRAAVRPAAAGVRGHGLGRQARLRPRRRAARGDRGAAAVAPHRARDQARLTRARCSTAATASA